jgi:hypothetical protein
MAKDEVVRKSKLQTQERGSIIHEHKASKLSKEARNSKVNPSNNTSERNIALPPE